MQSWFERPPAQDRYAYARGDKLGDGTRLAYHTHHHWILQGGPEEPVVLKAWRWLGVVRQVGLCGQITCFHYVGRAKMVIGISDENEFVVEELYQAQCPLGSTRGNDDVDVSASQRSTGLVANCYQIQVDSRHGVAYPAKEAWEPVIAVITTHGDSNRLNARFAGSNKMAFCATEITEGSGCNLMDGQAIARRRKPAVRATMKQLGTQSTFGFGEPMAECRLGGG